MRRKLVSIIILLVVFVYSSIINVQSASAATLIFDKSSGSYVVSVVGNNITHNFRRDLGYINSNKFAQVTVPDDGSTWIVSFTYGVTYSGNDSFPAVFSGSVLLQKTITTPGVFTGYSVKTATDAAAAANSNAYWALQNAAAANSQTAYGGNSAAYLAYLGQSYANNAATAANNAANNANTANTNITTANNILNNGTYGLSALNTKIANQGTQVSNVDTKVTNTQTQISNLDTKITNMQSLMAPSIDTVEGINGATCTTGNSYTINIGSSGATEYRAWLDNAVPGVWGVATNITLNGIGGIGPHTVHVQVRNANSTTAEGIMVFYKL